MVKDNIIAFVRKSVIALLDGVIEDFVHAGDIGARANHCRQILKRALQWIIKA